MLALKGNNTELLSKTFLILSHKCKLSYNPFIEYILCLLTLHCLIFILLQCSGERGIGRRWYYWRDYYLQYSRKFHPSLKLFIIFILFLLTFSIILVFKSHFLHADHSPQKGSKFGTISGQSCKNPEFPRKS